MLNNINITKIQSTMRSLFRLLGFQELQSPDIIIQQEQEIFSRRILELNAEELICLINFWPSYYKEEVVQQELDDYHLINQLKQYETELN